MRVPQKSIVALAIGSLTVASTFATPAIEHTKQNGSQVTTQLPRFVQPLHYDVSITPDAAASKFSATVAISLNVLSPTSSITLNAADLVFTRVTLKDEHGNKVATKPGIGIDAKHQTATFNFGKKIAKGHYHLFLDYSGVIGSQASGLFALDYDTSAGRKRALYTQFENSDARRMLPSWDEPNYKATFSLEATVPTGEMAVSNMPVEKRTDLANGYSVVKFAESPKMSTYLLFLGVGEFERATATVDGTEVGVITKKGDLPKAKFILDSSQAILHEYNDYFGVPYPLPKLDNIAAPGRSQFFSAMENWGSIFTFEDALLLDPAISTQGDKQRAFIDAAHETAHQWFGNLVTMQWWDDLWLNEGFASWMEVRTTSRLHPEWNAELSTVNHTQVAMQQDALQTSHPIVQHVETVDQARQAFDRITYQKGEAVIRMLENYVGADTWRAGVRAYMKKHRYGNTVSADFWEQIDKAAGQPISDIAHDFTLQPGVPMIKVDHAACQDGHTQVTLTQTEFSNDQPDKKPLMWRVPVMAKVVGTPDVTSILVSDGVGKASLPGCGVVLINAGQYGYYRSMYAQEDIAALTAGFSKLDTIDQLGLLADSYALGMAGKQSLSNFLDLAQIVPVNADPHVWRQIIEAFTEIHESYAGDFQRQKKFDDFAISRLSPVMEQTDWIAKTGEPDTVVNLREGLIRALGRLGDPITIAEARRRYAENNPKAMPAALRKVVMTIVAMHADTALWDDLHAKAVAEKSALLKQRYFDLLALSQDEELAKRALSLALTNEPGATTSAVMIRQVSNAHADLAFDFAIKHLDQVSRLVENGTSGSYISKLAVNSLDPAMLEKLNAFATANLDPSARGDTKRTLAEIGFRIKTRAENLTAIDAWLGDHAKNL